jgi:hypothetical protein
MALDVPIINAAMIARPSVTFDLYELFQDVLHLNEVRRVLHHFIDLQVTGVSSAVLLARRWMGTLSPRRG